jgi:hypothetical protein
MNEDSTQNLSSSHDETLRQILAAVNDLQIGVKDLQGRVESLESKVEERLYDTRPIWEKVVADIEQLQKGQQQLQGNFQGLHDEMRKGFRDLKRQFSILNDTFLEVRADYKDLDRRVYQIEEPQS